MMIYLATKMEKKETITMMMIYLATKMEKK